MANFSKLVITEKGKELLNQKLSSEKAMTYTKVALSSHEYAQDELKGLEQLADIRQVEAVRKTAKEDYDTVVVDAVFDNNSLPEGYLVKAAGLYARLEEQEEILFAVAVELSNASYMPEHTETITVIQLKLRIRLENAENINIFVDTAGTATIGDVLDVKISLEEHESNTAVHVSTDEKREWNESLNSAKEYSNEIYQQATGYTDQKISDLIGGAPETLDTLKEVADAIEENEDVVSALNAAIGAKANQTELDTHTGNGTIHVTATERDNWNLCGAKNDFLSKKTNIEYSYPDVESGLLYVRSGAESLTDAVKDATQKLSEYVLGIAPENIGALPVPALLKGSLNDCKNPGFYYAVGGNKITEKPQGVDSFGLLVTREGNLNRGQILFSSRKEIGIYARRWDSDSNVWTEWIRIIDSDGNAVSATKAAQDGAGNNIADTYLPKTGNSANNTITFTSADNTNPTAWTDVQLMSSGEKHSSLFGKISTMFKNVRYLYKMLGTTDISKTGSSTVTGAINALHDYLIDTQAKRIEIPPNGAVTMDASWWRCDACLIASRKSLFLALRWSNSVAIHAIADNNDVSFSVMPSGGHVFVANNLWPESTNYVGIFF